MSKVNTKRSAPVFREEKFGTIKAAPNPAAERLINSPDNALSQGLLMRLSIKQRLTEFALRCQITSEPCHSFKNSIEKIRSTERSVL